MALTINEKRQKLENISKMKLEIRALEEEISLLREESTSLAHPPSEVGIIRKNRDSGARFEKTVDRLIDAEEANQCRIQLLNEEIETIRKNINKLRYEEKSILIMHYYLGKTYRQIAGELYCSERTLARIMARALENLEL